MSRSFTAALAAALLLASPVRSQPATATVPTVSTVGCWSGVSWDELGIGDETVIKAE